jgi:NADPH2:quinone reductase
VKSLGAHEVIDRTAADVVEALKAKHPDGVAAIIDTGSDAAGLARLSEAVRKGGTVTSMKGAAAIEDLAKRGIKGVNIRTEVTQLRLDHLAGLAADGKLKAPRIQTFSLERAGEAFELIGQPNHLGKLVVKI